MQSLEEPLRGRSYYPHFKVEEIQLVLQFQITGVGMGLADKLVKGGFSTKVS